MLVCLSRRLVSVCVRVCACEAFVLNSLLSVSPLTAVPMTYDCVRTNERVLRLRACVHWSELPSQRKCLLSCTPPGAVCLTGLLMMLFEPEGETQKHPPPTLAVCSNVCGFAKIQISLLSLISCLSDPDGGFLSFRLLLFGGFQALNCLRCFCFCLFQWFAAAGEQQVLRGSPLL